MIEDRGPRSGAPLKSCCTREISTPLDERILARTAVLIRQRPDQVVPVHRVPFRRIKAWLPPTTTAADCPSSSVEPVVPRNWCVPYAEL